MQAAAAPAAAVWLLPPAIVPSEVLHDHTDHPTPSPPPWSLHPQLARDTVELGDLPLSRVLVVNDANWPWLLLVPRRVGIVEIIDLDEVEQAQLMTEITRVARALMKTVTGCDKLNIAALGNVVPQLHVHVIARREGDAGLAAAGLGRGASARL